MKQIFLLAAALIIIGAGCKKQNSLSPVGATADADANNLSIALNDDTLLIDVPPANPDNPYDAYGSGHNRLLTATRSVWANPSSSLGDEYDALFPYSPLSGIGDTVPDRGAFIAEVGNILADSAHGYADIIAGSSLSLRAKNYATAILHNVSILPQTDSFEDWLNSFTTIEGTIQNDASLNGRDRAALLKAASIARYSTVFWTNELYAQENPNSGHGTGVHTNSIFKKAWAAVKSFFGAHAGQIVGAGLADAGSLIGGGNLWSAAGASAGAW